MYILSIVGARPQFIKAAMVAEAIDQYNRRGHSSQEVEHALVHTGQHYNANMSEVFFDELAIPAPKYNLEVGSGSHAVQTALMLERIEEILLRERPDLVAVYGDTNSTLSGALAGAKLGIPVAHIEAGLRSFNRKMPEEINRVLTDHISRYLFCPTQYSVENLAKEGIFSGVFLSGDVMLDAVLKWRKVACARQHTLKRLGVTRDSYALLTLHRAGNTDSSARLMQILNKISKFSFPVVFPMHPRTRARIAAEPSLAAIAQRLEAAKKVNLIDPVSYLDMLSLEDNARIVITDSGGVQKESYFLGVPCVTLRSETEWNETLSDGWNTLTDPESDEMPSTVEALWNRDRRAPGKGPDLSAFGDGMASENIIGIITGLPNLIREIA